MTVAMQQRAFFCRSERQIKPSGLDLSRQKLLKQHGAFGNAARQIAFDQCGNLVAEGENTAWLKPDHRDPALHVRRECRERSFRLTLRFVDFADRKERASAADRPVVPVWSPREANRIAAS